DAPLSHRPCVYYEVRIDELQRARERRAQPFLVTDQTGTAEVTFDDTADVSFAVEAHVSLSGRRLRASTAASRLLFDRRIPPAVPIAISETAIFVGDEVTVWGVGTREAAPGGDAAGYREVPARYVVRAGTNAVLAILKKRR